MRYFGMIFPVIIAYLLWAIPTATSASPPLRSALTHWQSLTPAPHLACDNGPEPQKNLIFHSYYKSGSTNSEIAPVKLFRYRQAMKPIQSFEKLVSRLGDNYLAHHHDDATAQCLTRLLFRWAKAGAFLGKTNDQGSYVRKWVLATTASSYQKIAPALLKPEQKEIITQWFDLWTQKVIADYSTDTQKTSRNNNHLYWAAWAVMSAAVALDNKDYWQWAIQAYQRGIAHIAKDGTFPLEMRRGSKALHYHIYALAPLVMMAETAAVNGKDLYSYKGGRLHRAIKTALAAWENPSLFTERTGRSQTFVGKKSAQKLIWLEPYLARFPNAKYDSLIAPYRPLQSSRLGGGLTAIFHHNGTRN